MTSDASCVLVIVLVTSCVVASVGQNSIATPTPTDSGRQSTVTVGGPTNGTTATCSLVLAGNQSYASIRQQFIDTSQGYKVVVYFRLHVVDQLTGSVTSFEAGKTSDTFEPDSWIWATSKGKNLLRVPLDYQVLSLGMLTINSARMDINIDSTSADCFSSIPSEDVIDAVATFLSIAVTANGSSTTTDGPVVCRSAFAFNHSMFGMRGIGYRCCALTTSFPDDLPHYECGASFTRSWEIVWYGPLGFLCWIYVIAVVHLYKLYRHAFNKAKIRHLTGFHATLDDIKQDIINRIVKMSEQITNIKDIEDLVSFRETCGYLDMLGIDKVRQAKLTSFLKVLFVFFLFSSYYVIYAVFLYEYQRQIDVQTIKRLNDTQTVFLNLIGHFGWLFCRPDLGIFGYAVFESVYTLLVPFLAGYLYYTMQLRQEALKLKEAAASKFPATVQRANSVRYSPFHSRMIAFCNSTCGHFTSAICFLVLLIFVVFLAGPFVAYVAYFFGLGVFANIDIVSPWIVPLVICIHFFLTSFDPVKNLYKRIKEMIFTICMQKFKEIVIRRENELFLPRQLIEDFYIPRSRSPIYKSVLRVMWILAFLLLLILVILTIQYPYYHPSDSIISFLGVQVVFVLPLLAQLMNDGTSVPALEQQIMASDITDYIRTYLSQHQQSQGDPSGTHGGLGGASNEHDDAQAGADDHVVGSDGVTGGGNAFADTGSSVLNRLFDNPYRNFYKI